MAEQTGTTTQGTEALGWYKDVEGAFEDVDKRVREELQKEGFGILTEIAVHEKMKEKLGVTDWPRYHVLGACNPQLANVAIRENRDVGLLVPCNVTLEQLDGNGVRVGMARPTELLRRFGDDTVICSVAETAEERLRQAFDRL